MNVSDMPVTGTMTIVDMSGQLITAVQISIPVGGRVSRTSGSSDLQLARGIAGSVFFSHNGPPGSIIGEAFLLSSPTTLPEKFEAIASR